VFTHNKKVLQAASMRERVGAEFSCHNPSSWQLTGLQMQVDCDGKAGLVIMLKILQMHGRPSWCGLTTHWKILFWCNPFTNALLRKEFLATGSCFLSGVLNCKVQLAIVLACNAHVHWGHCNSHLSCALPTGGCHRLYTYLQPLTPNTGRSIC